MLNVLPFLVYRDYEVEKYGKEFTPLKELKCAFATRKLAEDFIKYQATIDHKTKYVVKEN